MAKEVVPSFDPWAPEGFNARRQREKALDSLNCWMVCFFFLVSDLVIWQIAKNTFWDQRNWPKRMWKRDFCFQDLPRIGDAEIRCLWWRLAARKIEASKGCQEKSWYGIGDMISFVGFLPLPKKHTKKGSNTLGVPFNYWNYRVVKMFVVCKKYIS